MKKEEDRYALSNEAVVWKKMTLDSTPDVVPNVKTESGMLYAFIH